MRKLVIVCFVFLSNQIVAQSQAEKEAALVIVKAGDNKKELEKAFYYYDKTKDSLKYRAMLFLLSNMDIHYSSTYYWADSLNKKIEFDELKYESFEKSIKAFDSLKILKGKLHPIPINVYDITTIKADYLIDNVERAFKAWKSPIGNNIGFENFCEYILPYRISIEPLQDWRMTYEQKYKWVFDSVLNYKQSRIIPFLIKDINRWFTCTYNLEKRNEPLPRLGSLQLLQRKKGFCEDVADLSVFALRSQGISATTDIVPYWATSSGSHMLNSSIENFEQIHFDVLFKEGNMQKLIREPGKVFRQTYSKQTDALAMKYDTSMIPNGILRNRNILDVTKEYWSTDSFNVPLKKIKHKQQIVYACVFNYQKWQPIWWSDKIRDYHVLFEDLSKGVVYLPMYYIKNKLGPASYPIAIGYNHKKVLIPDTINRITISLTEQENFLKFRTGKKYKLFYWNGNWKEIGICKATENIKALEFKNVPQNALLILIPEYSQKKERPFIITNDKRRIWF